MALLLCVKRHKFLKICEIFRSSVLRFKLLKEKKMKNRKFPQRVNLVLDKPLQKALDAVKSEYGFKDTQAVYYVLRKALLKNRRREVSPA